MDFKQPPKVNTQAITDASGNFTGPAKNANKVFAGPASGGDATPTFRYLVAADMPIFAPILASFSANGDMYIVAPESMTLETPTTAGTGTLTYNKAVAASPTSFSTATFPLTLATGDILRITCAAISGYRAVSFQRSA